MGISQHGITVITCHSHYEPRRAKYTRSGAFGVVWSIHFVIGLGMAGVTSGFATTGLACDVGKVVAEGAVVRGAGRMLENGQRRKKNGPEVEIDLQE